MHPRTCSFLSYLLPSSLPPFCGSSCCGPSKKGEALSRAILVSGVGTRRAKVTGCGEGSLGREYITPEDCLVLTLPLCLLPVTALPSLYET